MIMFIMKTSHKFTLIMLIIVLLMILLFFAMSIGRGKKNCETDSDCVVVRQGCNTGCYNKNHLPWNTFNDPHCFIIEPENCICQSGKCVPIRVG